MMKDTLITEKGGYWDSWQEENFSVSDAASPSQSPNARCRLSSMLSPSVNTLCLIVSSDALDWGDLYQFHIDANNCHWYETSRLKCTFAWVEVTSSWTDWTGRVHKVAREIITTWLKSERRQVGYSMDFVNAKALLERNGYRKALANPHRCGSNLDANEGVH
jgi:hypothetical protein